MSKKERLDRYGKVCSVVNYENSRPKGVDEVCDTEDFWHDMCGSMGGGSWIIAGFLLVCLIGLLLAKGLFGLGIWSLVYFVVCLVITEGLVNILLGGIGLAHTSPFFNCAIGLQVMFFLAACFYFFRGMPGLLAEKRKGLFFVFIGTFFTFLAALLSLAGFWDLWGLSSVMVPHVKLFLFVFLFSSALILKVFLLRRRFSLPGHSPVFLDNFM